MLPPPKESALQTSHQLGSPSLLHSESRGERVPPERSQADLRNRRLRWPRMAPVVRQKTGRPRASASLSIATVRSLSVFACSSRSSPSVRTEKISSVRRLATGIASSKLR